MAPLARQRRRPVLLALLATELETRLGGSGEEPSLAASPPLVGIPYVHADQPPDQARAGRRVLLTAMQPDLVRLRVLRTD
jgi:hypothetical protein